MLYGEREIGGWASLLIVPHPTVPFPVIPFSVSDLYTVSCSPFPHFCGLPCILHLSLPTHLLIPTHLPVQSSAYNSSRSAPPVTLFQLCRDKLLVSDQNN